MGRTGGKPGRAAATPPAMTLAATLATTLATTRFSCTAAVIRGKSKAFTIEPLQIEAPRDTEVLVRVTGAGICHSDQLVWDQSFPNPTPLPAVLGHEGAGIVEQVGKTVTKVRPGDHVVMAFGSCGLCINCQAGTPGYCLAFYALNFAGRRPDGTTPLSDTNNAQISGCFFCQSSFGSRAIAQERNVVKIDKAVPLDIMGPLGCGISTGAGTVLNTLRPKAGTAIAIFGVGSVGLAAVMAARVVGCTIIIAVDRHENRLAMAKELGATHSVNANTQNAAAEISAATSGTGVHNAIETTGSPKLFRQAVEALRVTGTCALVGAAAAGAEVALDMNNILSGRTIKGVVQGDSIPDVLIPQLIELWKQGRFPFDRLIRFYDLTEINEAFAAAASGAVIKPVLRP